MAARSDSMLQWYLKCTELCLLISEYCLSANELKQSTDLSWSTVFISSIIASVSKSLPILNTRPDSNGLPVDWPVVDYRNRDLWNILENTVACRFKWGKSQGDFGGTECIWPVLSQEEQELREKKKSHERQKWLGTTRLLNAEYASWSSVCIAISPKLHPSHSHEGASQSTS